MRIRGTGRPSFSDLCNPPKNHVATRVPLLCRAPLRLTSPTRKIGALARHQALRRMTRSQHYKIPQLIDNTTLGVATESKTMDTQANLGIRREHAGNPPHAELALLVQKPPGEPMTLTRRQIGFARQESCGGDPMDPAAIVPRAEAFGSPRTSKRPVSKMLNYGLPGPPNPQWSKISYRRRAARRPLRRSRLRLLAFYSGFPARSTPL